MPWQPPTPGTEREIELRHRRALIAGFGVVGRMTAQRLEDAGFDITLIELNLNTIETRLAQDKDVVYGSVCDEQTLHCARIEVADALIITIPNEKDAIRACHLARQLNPEIFIAVRTNFFSQGLMAQQAGADAAIVEEVVTAEAMKDAVVGRLLRTEQPEANQQ